MFPATCMDAENKTEDTRSSPPKNLELVEVYLFPACAAGYLFCIKPERFCFSGLIKAKQRGGTAARHSCAFGRRWTQTAKWRSLMHVNDPVIFLITDVNHRKPDAGCRRGRRGAARLYAWSQVVTGGIAAVSPLISRSRTDSCIRRRRSAEAAGSVTRELTSFKCVWSSRERRGGSNTDGLLSCMRCWWLHRAENSRVFVNTSLVRMVF